MTTTKPKQRQGKASAKAKPKPTTNNRRSGNVNKQMSRPKVNTNTLHQACALSDPFCQHAFGGKYAGASTSRTVPYTSHFNVTLSAGVSGNASLLVLPGYNYLYALPQAYAAPNFTYTVATANPATLPNVVNYRIVSWGLKIRPTMTPLTASGLLRVRTLPAETGATLLSINLATYNCSEYADKSMSHLKELAVVGPRLDYTCERFRSPATTNPTGNVADWVAPGWAPVHITTDGGPASSAQLTVEFVVHYECVFGDDDGTQQLATPGRPPNPLAHAAANQFYATAGSFFEGATASVGKQIESVLVNAITKGVGFMI